MENVLCCRMLCRTAGSTILGFYESRQDPLESGGSGGGGGNSAPEGFDRQGEAPAGGTGLGPAA
ncbi:Uncharacterised protein [Anaerotruncus sp. 2789STDY5834896]|uniref:Uncharacterized protein n=1 Tax=uncultured Anaerotruncus sp. TaxID=905011 RepID=A0A1C6IPQ4_9FIRM|nr:Uncharacterised protein [uncultured Anaerotruncus sp.]